MQRPASTIRDIYQRGIEALLTPVFVQELAREIRSRNLSYLPDRKLSKLARIALTNERRGIPGQIVEADCALIGSSILLAATKSPRRRLTVYDVFGMIPQPTEEDGPGVQQRYEDISNGRSNGTGSDVYSGYREDLFESLRNNLVLFGYPAEQNQVELVNRLVQETLSVDGSVSLAHIDVDWYEPVLVCLQRIVPRLVSGGTIVIDDYFDWSGCRKAVDGYFSDKTAMFRFDDTAGSLAIARK